MFKDMPATYREARRLCSDEGGHLVEIESQAEYELLEREWERVEEQDNGCDSFRGWWIGVNDLEKEGPAVTTVRTTGLLLDSPMSTYTKHQMEWCAGS